MLMMLYSKIFNLLITVYSDVSFHIIVIIISTINDV